MKEVHIATRMIKVVSSLLIWYTVSWTPFIVYEILIMSCNPDSENCSDYRYFRFNSNHLLFSFVF